MTSLGVKDETATAQANKQSTEDADAVSSVPPALSPAANNKFVRSNSFIIIDDHIPTLKLQLMRLKNSPPASIHLPLHAIQNKHQQQQSKRPPLSRQMKSVNQVTRVDVTPKQLNTSIIHFTSISNFRKVQDLIRTHLTGTQWATIPDVLVIPKPIGPRRILTALHTAINRPPVEPQFVPIATSPSSPGLPHYFANPPHSLVGTSQLGRTSPALTHLGGPDFDTAAANHLKSNASHSTLQTEVATSAPAPSLQSSTPPGLRTPGTAPGTPGFPSPAMLSHEALEYFSKAASENGGSSSTGVVLQSPDGRPQAMFFHHSSSSVRSTTQNSNFSAFINPAHVHNLTSTSMTAGSQYNTNSERLPHDRRNSSRPMIRELIGASDADYSTPPSSSIIGSSYSASSNQPSVFGGARQIEHAFFGFGTPMKPSGRTGGTLSVNPSDNVLNHAMALDKYEAISPKTPTVAFSPEAFYALQQQQQLTLLGPSSSATSSQGNPPGTNPRSETPGILSQLTPQQQQVLMNPRPSPMLRMPSVSANLPSSITATFTSPRRPPISHAMAAKSQRQTSSPTHPSRVASASERTEIVKSSSTSNTLASVALLAKATPRRASMGDGRFGKRRASRKPATTLVPPINVLIVEGEPIFGISVLAPRHH